jgi:CheY-like chemotaxis protein
MLFAIDYEVTEAEGGEQALAAVALQRDDLILMDTHGPARRTASTTIFVQSRCDTSDLSVLARTPVISLAGTAFPNR